MELQHFHIAGINYKKTDVSIRGKYALNEEQYGSLLQKATDSGLQNVFVLSTCNRTEIYGIAPSVEELSNLLCSETNGDQKSFEEICYIKHGKEAIEHLFSVASGLDSQILGDYEIVGQLRNAVKFAKANGNIGAFSERLVNTVFESSKHIKNTTQFSSGTVSVAFATIQFLRIHCRDIAHKKIAIIGTGKIGKNTCKNLIDYLGARDITLINRSAEKADALATELGLHHASWEQYKQYANEADILIVATNASEPLLSKKDFLSEGKKILIDLSIPANISTDVYSRPQTILVNVDDLSKMNDDTLHMREQEIPLVKHIIDEYVNEFIEWYQMYRNAPVIRAVKKMLIDIHLCPWYQSLQKEHLVTEEEQMAAIQKAVKKLAVKMREHHTQTTGCSYIEALHDFVAQCPVKHN